MLPRGVPVARCTQCGIMDGRAAERQLPCNARNGPLSAICDAAIALAIEALWPTLGVVVYFRNLAP